MTIQAAYGGAGWSPRARSLRQEIGSLWSACGVMNEWTNCSKRPAVLVA
jgi:hypothetical protein